MSLNRPAHPYAFLLTILVGLPFTPASAAPAPTLVIPAHALVPVVVINHLKSGRNKEGENVFYRTFATVYGPHHEVLIPAGSEGFGKITESKGSGMAGKGGKLKFTCEYIVAGGNTHIIFANADLSRQGRTYNPITTLLVGGPLSLFSKGRDIDVDEGTPFLMEVAADTNLMPVQDKVLGTVSIVPNKHKAKGYPATLTAYTADSIVVITDKGENTLKLKDVKQIILPPQPMTAALPAPPAQTASMPKVAASVPAVAPPSPAFQSLITFANGAQSVGTLVSFDGSTYTVSTPKGTRQFKAAAIKSITALAPAQAALPTAPR